VLVVVDPDQVAEARAHLAGGIELVPIPIDDSWIRDSGPIVVTDGRGGRALVDFGFNGWGGRYPPYDRDDALPAALAAHLGMPRYRAPIIAEGGAITVDGEGTLVTTASCLLNENRNPGATRAHVDGVLRDHLGAETVIWFDQGWSQSRDTDGHIDGIALFVAPGRLFLLDPSDASDPDHRLAAANRAVLASTPDARGRTVQVISHDPGAPVDIPYANVYVANGVVIVPGGAGDAADEIARADVAAALPGRDIVQVPARVLHEGGGGPHCITQQIPAA
jgi:agmatine deiminase